MPARKPIKRVEQTDIAVARSVAPMRNHPLTRILGDLSDIADQPPLRTIGGATIVAGALARSERLTLAGIRMLAAHHLATVAKTVVKKSIDRTRPEEMLGNGDYESGEGRHDSSPWNSFPSGHTAGAVAVARAIGHDYPKAALPAMALAITVSAIQVPRGKHYVSDVIAGALIGLAADGAVNALGKKLGTVSE